MPSGVFGLCFLPLGFQVKKKHCDNNDTSFCHRVSIPVEWPWMHHRVTYSIVFQQLMYNKGFLFVFQNLSTKTHPGYRNIYVRNRHFPEDDAYVPEQYVSNDVISSKVQLVNDVCVYVWVHAFVSQSIVGMCACMCGIVCMSFCSS